MRIRKLPAVAAVLLLAAILCGPALAATITSFTFQNTPVGVNNSPAPAVGSGTATPLGMTNNFTPTPSITEADVLAQAGTSGPAVGNNTWRIRGGASGSGNGWAATAPQYSQGAEFLAGTAGFQNIVLTYDWSSTTQGVKHQQVQYTANSSTWSNVGPIQTAGATEAWINGITIDLSSVTAVNNNPLFGVRIVSAYAPTGPNTGQYVNLAGSVINSTSGNWRLDNITISGTAIPEPTSFVLCGTGVAGFAALGRRRRRR